MESLKWLVLNAEGKAIGRCAEEISKILRGKNALPYSPNKLGDCGVVVINAGKVKLTGNKAVKKEYFFHPNTRPGHWKTIALGKLLKENPRKVIMGAVKGMLPKNRLNKIALRRIRVYPGAEHPHAANISSHRPSSGQGE
ncbi:MAG: 50S ribosomal protein L13 [Elusimicrobia bacterium CG08_land_8_20_14_0_20_44_26]|nr:MAG: 50S ribosomal protein L13 [Elusimicrobia bacterium CG08_land_8_20_14_0_20_44_26]